MQAPETTELLHSPTALAKQQCSAIKKNGERCKAWAVKGETLCAGHSGKGIAANPQAFGKIGAANSGAARSDRAKARKMGTLDALRVLSESDVTVQAFKRALASDDPALALRAAEALMARVHGKPKETVRTETVPAELEAIRTATPEQLDELWRKLQDAEAGEVVPLRVTAA